jgi:hypothetical protein
MGRTIAMSRWLGAAVAAALLLACGGSSSSSGPTDNCPNLAGAYPVTTEIMSGYGSGTVTDMTFTFTQTAPSCDFEMDNSHYSSASYKPVYKGRFNWTGTEATFSWESVSPSPMASGYALSYPSSALTMAVSGGVTRVFGSFNWAASSLSGSTNVCNGTVSTCTTPQ